MIYDKNNKKKVVLDYHNSEINNYLFDTNKFSHDNKKENIKNKNKQFCSKYALEKKYAGFDYYGNKNKCYLFNSNQFDKKIDKEFIDKYNIVKYNRTKYEKDFSTMEDQKNILNYFSPVNSYNLTLKNKIKEFDTESLDTCLSECKNNSSCKNALYFEQPKECTFYNSKKFKNKNEKNDIYDSYAVKKIDDKIEIFHKNFDDKIGINNNNNNNNNHYYFTVAILGI